MNKRSETPAHSGKTGEAGFTLVELLVVMGVIIALVGMTFFLAAVAGDNEQVRAKTEIRLLMQAVTYYASENGGAYPPDSVPPEVEILPEIIEVEDGGEDEEPLLREEKESCASLIFYLTRRYYLDIAQGRDDPQEMGERRSRAMGPFLSLIEFKSESFAYPVDLDDDIKVEFPEPGYTGKTTWLLDPWGTPYRYFLQGGGGYVIESAGEDMKFGLTLKDIQDGVEESDEQKEQDNDNLKSYGLSG